MLQRASLFLILFCLMLSSCIPKPTVRTVEGYPEQANRGEDKSIASIAGSIPASFRYGELNPIRSLDPLYADNDATYRVIMQIYEGLLAYDANDQVIPALASAWEVSDDSLQYQFRLRRAYFHDNPAFNNGLGRKILSYDVRRCFERMALLSVPPKAAQMFMYSIRGFDAYFTEQHQVFDPEQRRLKGIGGILTPNDSTIIFDLVNPDPFFLEKLASPLAVVYPDEILDRYETGLSKNPVGSGPFSFREVFKDTLWVLERNQNYWQKQSLPKNAASRIEILNLPNESTLYKRFAARSVQGLPNLGPLMVKALIDSNGNLMPTFAEQYTSLRNKNIEPIRLYLNTDNFDDLGIDEASRLLNRFDFAVVDAAIGSFAYEVELNRSVAGDISQLSERFPPNTSYGEKVVLAFPNDNLSRYFGRIIGNQLARSVGVQLVQSEIVSRDIHLILRYESQFIPVKSEEPLPNELIRIRTRRFGVFSNNTQGFKLNSFSWWLDLRNVTVDLEATPAGTS